MRHLLVAVPMLMCIAAAAHAEVRIQVGLPGISIGVNMPRYPQLVLVPGTPVYYDAHSNSNYFFYDGAYWVYAGDNWYVSSWYNGPWDSVDPNDMPLFVLRVPVRYYRQPPTFFASWRGDAAPRWNDHWGNRWHGGHDGWDQWDRKRAPRAAPLPTYQRKYSGKNYPGDSEQQGSIRARSYRHQPREAVTRRQYAGPPTADRQSRQGQQNNGQQDTRRQGKGQPDKGRPEKPNAGDNEQQDKNGKGNRGNK
jgi:hypothetical protein